MAGSRPNILYIMSDDHAVQAIGAYGSRINQTPNLDRLAAEGGLFVNSFCCNSLCAPSRAAILTGKHSHANGQLTLGERFDGSQTTFPKLLQAAGYNTCLIGKWHLNSDPTGFDHWEVLPGQGNYYSPEFITPEGRHCYEGAYSTDKIAEMTMDWLSRGRDQSKPFMAMCHFKAPHRPWMPAPRYFSHFDSDEIPVPDTLFDDYSERSGVLKENKMQISRDFRWQSDLKVFDPGPNVDYYITEEIKKPETTEFGRMTPAQRQAWDEAYGPRNAVLKETRLDPDAMTRWAYQRYVKDYLRVIQGVDDNVGRLLDHLELSGLAENTIVIYCSDQGFYLGEHGWYDKRWMFEESLRMPLMIRWPGRIAPGTRYEQLVQNIDYAPTLLEAAGVEPPADLHGTSLLPVVDSGEDVREDLYYHYYAHGGHGVPMHDGVRNARYKLIHFYTAGDWNLFDLETDPREMRSVHADPAYAEVFAALRTRYDELRREFAVPERVTLGKGAAG